jgi:ParB-like chromosome segregation protein Spo0J
MTKEQKGYLLIQQKEMDEYKITQEVVAEKAGKSLRTVIRYFQGLSNNEDVRKAVVELIEAERLKADERQKQMFAEMQKDYNRMTGKNNFRAALKKVFNTSNTEYKFAQ